MWFQNLLKQDISLCKNQGAQLKFFYFKEQIEIILSRLGERKVKYAQTLILRHIVTFFLLPLNATVV